MNQNSLAKRRFLIAAVVVSLFAACSGIYMLRQAHENNHYATIAVQDKNGQISHIGVSKKEADQMDQDANRMLQQANQERKFAPR
jgi:hypothetical protein